MKSVINVLEVRNNLYDEDEKYDGNDKKEGVQYLQYKTDIDSDLQAILLKLKLLKGVALLELATGSGGQDAMLFPSELFQLYESYANYKDWEDKIVSVEKSDMRGIKNAN